MATMTLLELKNAARQRADMTDNLFVSESEIRTYLNQDLAELHGLLMQCYGEDYFTVPVSLSVSANAESVNLPSGNMKVRGVDVLTQDGTPPRYVYLNQFNWNERNRYNSGTYGQAVVGQWWTNLRYRVRAGVLYLTPPTYAAITLRLWTIQEVTPLVDDTDTTETYDSLNGWLEYVIVSTAIKMRDKQESDTSVLRAQKDQLARRILSEATNRDAGPGETIRDKNATGNGWGGQGGYGVDGGWW